MKKKRNNILLLVFLILFIVSVFCDCLIFYDFFDPCRVYMDECGKSFTFNLVHSKLFLKGLAIENLFNILVSTRVIYKNIGTKRYFLIGLGIISVLTTFSLWLLLMGEFGLIFS